MIKICPHCSGVDIDGVKKAFPNELVISGCNGICKNIKDLVYVKVNGTIVKAESNYELISEIKKIVENKI